MLEQSNQPPNQPKERKKEKMKTKGMNEQKCE